MELETVPLNGGLLESASVTEEGNPVLTFGGENRLYLYSGEDGKLLTTVDLEKLNGKKPENAMNMITAGNRLILQKEDELSVYSIDGKEEVKVIPYEFPPESRTCLAAGKNGGLLIADKKGLHYMGREGTLWETIIEGRETSYGLGVDFLANIYVAGEKEDEFGAVLFTDGKYGYKLVRYVYDEKKQPPSGKKLSIYSLNYDGAVQNYINRYQMKYRDVQIDYIVGREEDGAPAGDVIKALNAELLNGRGPNILILDGLPAKAYIEKGVLSDISGMVKPLADSGKLLKSVTASYIGENEKVYQIPLAIRLPWVIGKKEAVDCLGNMEKTAEYIKNGDGTAYTEKMSYEGLASMMLSLEYASLFEGAEPDSNKMKGFLEGLEVLAENIGAMEEPDFKETVVRDRKSEAGFDVRMQTWEEGDEPDLYDYRKHLEEGRIELAFPEFWSNINRPDDYYLKKEKGLELRIFNHAFIPAQIIGLCKGSGNSEQAVEFLRYILEEDPEDYMKAEDARADSYRAGYTSVYADIVKAEVETYWSYWTQGDEFGTQLKKMDKKDYTMMDEIEALEGPLEIDQELFDTAVNGAVSFLSGSVTADQAANEICSRIRLYQAEQG